MHFGSASVVCITVAMFRPCVCYENTYGHNTELASSSSAEEPSSSSAEEPSGPRLGTLLGPKAKGDEVRIYTLVRYSNATTHRPFPSLLQLKQQYCLY